MVLSIQVNFKTLCQRVMVNWLDLVMVLNTKVIFSQVFSMVMGPLNNLMEVYIRVNSKWALKKAKVF